MTTQPTLALHLAEQVRAFFADRAQLSPAIRARTTELLLDHLGNALGGSRAESSERLRRALAHVPPGPFTVVGAEDVVLPEYAALLNGAAAHALESDDTHQPSSTHPGAPVFPVALAIGELTRADGLAVTAAAVAGYEVVARLGAALDPARHYERGFHPTATCGVFGAATAAGLLLGLTPAQLASAWGICGSQAGGLLEFLGDGSPVKRLHPGWAAFAGITAARLAREGFGGPVTVFEGVHGFFTAMTDAPHPELLQGDWSDPAVLHTSIKAHACCRYEQAPIDALLHCLRQGGLSADDVEEVELGILSVAWPVVVEPWQSKLDPRTVVDAQFSMPYGAAVALEYGRASVHEYREQLLDDPRLRELMRRVRCVHDASLDAAYPHRWPATARVRTRDGREYATRVDHPKGDPESPLSWEELTAKFHALSEGVLSPDVLDRVVEEVRRFPESPSLCPLTELLGTAVRASAVPG